MSHTLDRIHQRETSRDRHSLAHELGFADIAVAQPATGLATKRISLADYGNMQAAFDDLAGRADTANPFMSPALVAAAAAGLPPDKIVVLAAFDDGSPDRLLGVWCLRRQRDIWSGACEVLQAPILPRYECLASPVLDKARAQATLAAMLAHVRHSADLPSVIRATAWPTSFGACLPKGWHATAAETWQRAMLAPEDTLDAETYLRQSMGKALNKRNNRSKQFAERGCVTISSRRGPEAVAAFEHYIRLEAKGWKGGSGTALAEVPEDAAYMRAAIAALAETEQVSVDMISLDDVPIAVGVVVEAAGNNLFWKAAFDEDHARFAPGSLLHLVVTRRLFAEGRAALDSGMMEFTSPAHLPWSERADMARVTISFGDGGFAARAGAAARHGLRRIRNRLGKA